MDAVTVKIYGTDDKHPIGAAQARAGYPLEIRITRANNSSILHLSLGEATQLSDALSAARAGTHT